MEQLDEDDGDIVDAVASTVLVQSTAHADAISSSSSSSSAYSAHDSVEIYLWSGAGKTDHAALRTRGARGYELRVLSEVTWNGLPDSMRETDELRIRQGERRIYVKPAGLGIDYRIDLTPEHTLVGSLTDHDLVLPEGTLAGHLATRRLESIKWKIIEVIASREPSFYEAGIYVSFYPQNSAKIGSKRGYFSVTKSFDSDRVHYSELAVIRINQVALDRLEAGYQAFLQTNCEFSFMASTVFGGRNTKNCVLLVMHLLQEAGLSIPSFNSLLSRHKTFMFMYIHSFIIEMTRYKIGETKSRRAPCSLGMLVFDSNAVLFSHMYAIRTCFAFNWLSYFINEKSLDLSYLILFMSINSLINVIVIKYIKQSDMYSSLPQIASTFIYSVIMDKANAVDMYSSLSQMASTLIYSAIMGKANAVGMYLMSAVIYLGNIRTPSYEITFLATLMTLTTFSLYFLTHILYERTLTPHDLKEILIYHSQGITKSHEPSIMSFSYVKAWLKSERFLSLIFGAIYAYGHVRHVIKDTKNLQFSNPNFYVEVILQTLITQFVHFDRQASAIAMATHMSIGKLRNINYMNSSGVLERIHGAAYYFCEHVPSLFLIMGISGYIYLLKTAINNVCKESKDDEQSIISANMTNARGKIALGLLVATPLIATGFWAYKRPEKARQVVTEMASHISDGICRYFKNLVK